MKKEYIKPRYKVYPIRPAAVICGSGDGIVGLSLGSSEGGDTQPVANDDVITGEVKSTSLWDDEW